MIYIVNQTHSCGIKYSYHVIMVSTLINQRVILLVMLLVVQKHGMVIIINILALLFCYCSLLKRVCCPGNPKTKKDFSAGIEHYLIFKCPFKSTYACVSMNVTCLFDTMKIGDKMFGEYIGLIFQTPEEYFLGH